MFRRCRVQRTMLCDATVAEHDRVHISILAIWTGTVFLFFIRLVACGWGSSDLPCPPTTTGCSGARFGTAA